VSRVKRLHLGNQTLESAQHDSFTLIELLVVIAIISILAALLTPAISAAKQTAQDAVCGQNQRQVHMAIMLYTHDHDNKYPGPIVWDQQYRQIYLFSNYISPLTFFRCPLSRGDVADPAWSNIWYTPTPVNGSIQWTAYKLNRGKANLCFFDGHVELLPQSVYSGKEPGMPPTAPDGWWNWGLRDL
jgi:prepilin-type N-terminal cleavage/methylation domain-containing protein/prepilin-type processing-associated H-X9-DG protein